MIPQSSELEIRSKLAKKIARFPRQVRAEQIRAYIKHLVVVVLYSYVYVGLGVLVVHLLRRLLNASDLVVPGFEAFAAIAPFAFGFWACYWPITRTLNRISLRFFGVRSKILRRVDQAPTEDAVRSGARIGLHLRAFGDEDGVVPASRGEIPRAVQSIYDVFFVSVANPSQHAAVQTGFPTLEIPGHAWKDTVFDFIRIASVIVVDTNAGLFHWADEIQESSILSLGAMSNEFRLRLGVIDELREIISNDYAYKTVAVVPPGWAEWKESGEIAEQIAWEECAASCAKELHPLLRSKGEFPRTALKRMLLDLPHTVATEDEIRTGVEKVLSVSPPQYP